MISKNRKMLSNGWGMYPKIDSQRFSYDHAEKLKKILQQTQQVIPFGNGRSYGDSALNHTMVDNKQCDFFLDFDDKNGLLHVESGILLAQIITHFAPRGWFLKISPGTKFITVGGAIAADVHGKNHHLEGCFSECIEEFSMMLADGKRVVCSKTKTPELFRATCGGQGLTGIILDAKIYLKKIYSQYISQTTIKAKNLREIFQAFEQHQNSSYSVAWIDCLAKGNKLGRSLLMVGEFSDDGDLAYQDKSPKTVPFYLPSFTLNPWSIKLFNWLYYHRVSKRVSHQLVDIDQFFYPLDALHHWNRIYGKQGFLQYQFILPKKNAYLGLREILEKIADFGRGSFLAVLKLYGKANENWLSFPMEGYSIALDFKIDEKIFAFLEVIDQIVLQHQGRFYLAKDARVSKSVFEQGYRHIERFREYRVKHNMDKKFQSLQSKRLRI